MRPEARALLALAAALVAAVPGAVRAGGLALAAEPQRLLLGRDASAELRVLVDDPALAPEDLTFAASLGSVEDVRRVPGGFTARYVAPPGLARPAVAIVAALARGAALDGWVAIPLDGQGTARVAARPGEPVTLRIAERTFGPVVAGEDGVARVRIVVPPGVAEGHRGFRPVDLAVPETPRILAVAEREAVLADRAERVRVLAWVVAPHGSFRWGDVPSAGSTRGTVEIVARQPGAYEVLWSLPPGPAGEDRLSLAVPGAPARELRVRSDPGPPAHVFLAFDREAHVAGEGRGAAVRAWAVDAAGNPTAAPLRLSADGAEVLAESQREPGALSGHLALDPHLGGRTDLLVTASVLGTAIEGRRALPLRPAAPAGATAAPGSLVAAGEPAVVRVDVRDRFGNPVRDPALTISAARGKVVAVALEGDAYAVRYAAPPRAGWTTDALLVGSDRVAAPLALVPPRGPRALLVSGGAAWDPGGGFTVPRAALAVDLAARSVPALPALAWRLEADLLGGAPAGLASGRTTLAEPADRPGRPRREPAGMVPGTVDALGGALRAGASLWTDRGRLALFASGAAGLHLGTTRDAAGETAPAIGPTLRLAAGAGLRFPWGAPFLEAGVTATRGALRGDWLAATISAGVRLERRDDGDDPAGR